MACGFPRATSPSPLEVHSSGTSLYVLEVYEEFIDDIGVHVGGVRRVGPPMPDQILSTPPGGIIRFERLGVSRLKMILGSVLKARTGIKIIGVDRRHFGDGEAGVLRVPGNNESFGFLATLRPSLAEDGRSVHMDYSLARGEAALYSGQIMISMKESVLIQYSDKRGRHDVVILHVASIEPSP